MRMDTKFRTRITPSAGKEVERLKLSFIASENTKRYSAHWKTVQQIFFNAGH
jgi:hypothetical protein